MGFPKAAPLKPQKINYAARRGAFAALMAWSFGFLALGEYLDMFRPLKRYAEALSPKNDPRFMKEIIEHLDKEAQKNLNEKYGQGGSLTAAQLREARARMAEANLTNEVREFFIGKNPEKDISESESKFTDIEKVKPGVYGQVTVTRSIEKENQLNTPMSRKQRPKISRPRRNIHQNTNQLFSYRML